MIGRSYNLTGEASRICPPSRERIVLLAAISTCKLSMRRFGAPWLSLNLALKLFVVTVTMSVTNIFLVVNRLPVGRFEAFFE